MLLAFPPGPFVTMSSASGFPQRLSVVLTSALLSLLVACSTTPMRSDSQDAALNAIYAGLARASHDYEQALQLARRGDNARSQQALETALDALRTGSAQCLNTRGCDPQRFLSAYDHALRLKDGSFLGTEDDAGDESIAAEQGTAAESGVLTALPQAQRTVALLQDHKLSELVATNGPVKAALQLWLTQMRPNLIRAWVDYQYLRFEMWPEYRQAGLPEAILFGLIAKESGGRVHAVSGSGAAGPLQFMSGTAMRFGLGTVDGFDQRFDPALAARASAEYLNEQLAQLNDNLALVLAAYNGGEGRVGRLAATNPNASFWDPDIYFALPAETREYVPMVLAAAWLFLHPHRYNLHFPEVDGQPGHIILTRPASLNELAVCLGDDEGARYGWFRTLRNLNPQLDPAQVQPMGARITLPHILENAYAQSCTDGRWVALAEDLQSAQMPVPPPGLAADAPAPSPRRRAGAAPRAYTVRRGDTLYSVARRFDCDDIHVLARHNHLHPPGYDLRPGQKLELASCLRR